MIKRAEPSGDAAAEMRAPEAGTDHAIRDAANLFKLLSDETRLRILTMLSERVEMCVRDLWQRLGQSQPAVSHHLGLLRAGGVVDTRHEGKHIYYRINPPRFQEVLSAMRLTHLGLRMLSRTRHAEAQDGAALPEPGSAEAALKA